MQSCEQPLFHARGMGIHTALRRHYEGSCPSVAVRLHSLTNIKQSSHKASSATITSRPQPCWTQILACCETEAALHVGLATILCRPHVSHLCSSHVSPEVNGSICKLLNNRYTDITMISPTATDKSREQLKEIDTPYT
eukprot:1094721-Amphidinium_carterae.1